MSDGCQCGRDCACNSAVENEQHQYDFDDIWWELGSSPYSSGYKYMEDKIISEFYEYVDSTYGEHYKLGHDNLECFDAWIALGSSSTTFRDNAMKYLWRFGAKDGKNKKDLMKAMHYVLLMMYVEFYKDNDNGN